MYLCVKYYLNLIYVWISLPLSVFLRNGLNHIFMNIKKKIQQKGFTISQVASLMTDKKGGKGVTQSALSQMIAGNPTIDKLREIAGIIGVPVAELVSDSPGITALVRKGDDYYQANTVEELESIVARLKAE